MSPTSPPHNLMPTTLPPAPPSPEQAPSQNVVTAIPTRVIMPEELPPVIPGTRNKKKSKKRTKKDGEGGVQGTGEKKKKKKKGSKKSKEKGKDGTNTKTSTKAKASLSDVRNGNSHQQQYNTIEPINYPQQQNTSKNKVGGIFSSLFQPNPSHVKSLYANNSKPSSGRRAQLMQNIGSPRTATEETETRRLMRVNIGVTNSADGEGTTIPQILHRMRVATLTLSGLTIAFESWAMIFNTIFLKADKVILGWYLLFFVGLLLCFEFVRGTPKAHSISMMGIIDERRFVDGNLNLNMQHAASEMADVVWRNALEERWARQLRYFLQDNFGIFYSCIGRAFFFMVIGGLAFGQDFILIQVIGIGFMLMGIWLITLRMRYPSLEKALVMDLEHEFGGVRSGGSQSTMNSTNNDNESVISWSNVSGASLGGSMSVRSNSNSSNNSERRSLLASRPTQ